jgi:hypothetical protein
MLKTWASSAPKAMTALTSELKAAVATLDNGPRVHMGPFISQASDQRVLVVGWAGLVSEFQGRRQAFGEDMGLPPVSGTSAPTGLAPGAIDTFTIGCASVVRSGSNDEDDVAAALQQAYDQSAVVGSVCHGPPWLSGSVSMAEVGESHEAHLVQDRRGILAVVLFGIRCSAFAAQ